MATLHSRGGVVGVVVLLAALSSLHLARSSPVPGDQYPTVGLTLGGYTYSVNVTSYANVSADVRDIIRATPNFGGDFGVFTDANTTYAIGKNAFRNQAVSPPVFRIPQAVVYRNYSSNGSPPQVEAWYELAATRFYTGLNRFYLDKYISDPLAGINEFNKATGGELASVRKPIIDASILFYPVLYFYHEIDAGWNALKRAALGGIVPVNVQSAADESQDAVGCILAPNVINGKKNERMAPGYNPWDVSNRLGAHFCTCAPHRYDKGEEISHANKRFLELAKNLQDIFVDGASATSLSADYGRIRGQMQHVLNVNQIQLTLEAADQASDCEVIESCITQFQRGATLDDQCGVISKGAASWAHWRMAMPALWSEVPSERASVYKAKLMAIADLLHPTAWARITSKSQLRDHFDDIVEDIKDAVKEAGYGWHEIANCQRRPNRRHSE